MVNSAGASRTSSASGFEGVDVAAASCTRPGSAAVPGAAGPAAAAPDVRPMSPAARLQGAAALLARPGSPLQPAASRGTSGNLSSSSTHRSQTASPQLT
jgi:hypothetical protein